MYMCGVFHSHGGTPIAGWFRRKKPTKIDRKGGTPILGNPQIVTKKPCPMNFQKLVV